MRPSRTTQAHKPRALGLMAATAIALCLSAGAAQADVITTGDTSIFPAGSTYVGNTGTGTLTINNGSVVTNTSGHIGRTASSTGTATVTGAGSLWNNSEDLYVGNGGTGTMTVSNGGIVTNDNSFIGDSIISTGPGTGTVTVTGTNSRWENGGNLNVGRNGTGTMTISNGGVVTSATGHIANSAQSEGTVTVTGANSRWESGGVINVGRRSNGSMTVSNGGVVISTSGVIGNTSDAVGDASVSGTGSQWNTSGNLNIGYQGTGRLDIANGGLVTAVNAYVGSQAGSMGTLAFGIGDDGSGTNTIVSGLLNLTEDLYLDSDRSFFDLTVDAALDLALNTEFTLITYNEAHGLFSFLDEFDVVQTLMDNSYFTTGIYTFLVDYRATAFVLTLNGILDTGPMGVPEPGPLGLIAFGLMGVGVMRLRRRQQFNTL